MSPEFSAGAMLTYQKVGLLIALGINIWSFAAVLRTWKNRQSTYALVATHIGTFGWAASLLCTFLLSSTVAAQLAFFFAEVGVIGLIWFALVYSKEVFRPLWILTILPSAFIAISSLLPDVLFTNLVIHETGYLEAHRTPAMFLYGVISVVAGLAPAFILHHRQITEKNPLVRQRMQWMSGGICITLIASLVTNVILPNVFHYPNLNSLGPVFSIILATTIVWLIIHQHYVDGKRVRAVLTGRIALAIIALCIFFGLRFALQLLSPNSPMMEAAAAAATISIIAIWANSLQLFGEKLVLADVGGEGTTTSVRELVDALTLVTSTAEIEEVVSGTIAYSMRGQNAQIILSESCPENISRYVAMLVEARSQTTNPPALYITDSLNYTLPDAYDKHRLAVTRLTEALKAAVIVPITHKHQIIGLLTIGQKDNGKGYTNSDAMLLTSYAHILPPFLIRASLMRYTLDITNSLEAAVRERTNTIIQIQEETRDVTFNLAQRITEPLEAMRAAAKSFEHHTEDDLEVIEEALEEAKATAQGLIEYTRARSVALTPDRIYNLSEIVDSIITHAKETAIQTNVELVTHIAENIHARGNAISIHNGIAHVMSNAFRYLKPDKKEIHIDLTADDTTATLIVSDTGVGISPEGLLQIGTPFFRIRNRDDMKSSKGVGLAIAKSAITRHGGTLEIKSTEDEGTVVTVKLPIVG